MSVTVKGKALMDVHMSRQSMDRAAQAVTKNYKKFKLVVPGGLAASKRKRPVDIVPAIPKTIDSIRDPKKKMEKVELYFVVRDSSTMFNYGDHSARYEQIKKELREYLEPAILNPYLSHEKSYDFEVYIEGTLSEKEFWQ